MTQKSKPGKTQAQAREDRLKAALKANLSRRKAQAKARVSPGSDGRGEKNKNETSSEGG